MLVSKLVTKRAERKRSMRPHLGRCAGITAVTLLIVPVAYGQEAADWLQRAAAAAQQLNYVGTVVYQHAGRVEMSRLLHLFDSNGESERLSNLDGPAREVVRNDDVVRCYYPDAKVVMVEPRTQHNAFPSLLPKQLVTLTTYYVVRKAEIARVAGLETQAYVFEPKDGLRYGHKLWADIGSGLLLKARLINERHEAIEQFAFSDIQLGAKLDREMTKPPFTTLPPDWQLRELPRADLASQDTGWVVKDLPAGFSKVVEGYRNLRGKTSPVAHLVFSDGLVSISVFIEPTPSAPQAVEISHQGGINVYTRQLDDYLVTVMGEAPGTTVRQIAYSVTHP